MYYVIKHEDHTHNLTAHISTLGLRASDSSEWLRAEPGETLTELGRYATLAQARRAIRARFGNLAHARTPLTNGAFVGSFFRL